MRNLKVKVKSYAQSEEEPNKETTEDSLFIVQELKKKFSVWIDPYGEFEDGEDPIYSAINGRKDFNSLDEVRKALLSKGAIAEDAEFIDIETGKPVTQ